MKPHMYGTILEEFKNSQVISDSKIGILPQGPWTGEYDAVVEFKNNTAMIRGGTALDESMAALIKARGLETSLLYGKELLSIAGDRLKFHDVYRFSAEINFGEFLDCRPTYDEDRSRLCEMIKLVVDAEKKAKIAKEQYLMKYAG